MLVILRHGSGLKPQLWVFVRHQNFTNRSSSVLEKNTSCARGLHVQMPNLHSRKLQVGRRPLLRAMYSTGKTSRKGRNLQTTCNCLLTEFSFIVSEYNMRFIQVALFKNRRKIKYSYGLWMVRFGQITLP